MHSSQKPRDLIKIVCFLFLAFGASACFKGPGIGKQDNGSTGVILDGQTSAEGVTSGLIDANAGVPQTLFAQAADIAGSAVTFAPGSLSINMNVSLEQGSDVASDIISDLLGIEGAGVNQASNALVVQGSADIDAIDPFSISLPIGSTGLRLTMAEEYLVIFYRIKKFGDDEKIFNGIVPTNKIRIEDGKAVFETRYFGSFQAAYISKSIDEVKEVESDKPILTKNQADKLSPISWPAVSASFENGIVNFSSAVTGFGDGLSCQLFVDSDLIAPWNHVCKNLSTATFEANLTDNSDADTDNCVDDKTALDPNATEEVVFARFVCEDASGRVSVSPWSTSSVTLPAGQGPDNSEPGNVPEVENLAQGDVSNAFIELSWTFDTAKIDQIKRYFITYQKGSEVPENCNTNDYPFAVIEKEEFEDSPGIVFHRVFPLDHSSTYSIRVCAEASDGTGNSKGLGTSLPTESAPFPCTGGGDLNGLGSACVVNSPISPLAPGVIISGAGDLIIDGGSLTMSDPESSISFYMGGDIELKNNGSITANIHEMEAENIIIGETASGLILADNLGYPGGSAGSDGVAPVGISTAEFDGTNLGAGATHGGEGFGKSFPGQSYGDFTDPRERGAGGAGSNLSAGGNGGGVINLFARNELVLGANASVSAKGNPGDQNGSSLSGGGAGGSIQIQAENLDISSGSFSVSVAGGSGRSGSSNGLAGGGGRIAVYHGNSLSWTPALESQFVTNGGIDDVGVESGAAGTLFISELDDMDGTSRLIFQNTNAMRPEIAHSILPTYMEYDFDIYELIIRDYVKVGIDYGPGFDFANPTQNLFVSNLTIDIEGRLSADGKGALGGLENLPGNQPPLSGGAGQYESNTLSGSGGGHGGAGGRGGDGTNNVPGGTTYSGLTAATDDALPLLVGSGGGGSMVDRGGNGGGIIYLEIQDFADIEGQITAYGLDGTSGSGGGAGGYVVLSSGTLKLGSAGYISAKGGDSTSNKGGGGGGGYVHIFFDNLHGSSMPPASNIYVTGGGSTEAGNDGADGQFQCNSMSCP